MAIKTVKIGDAWAKKIRIDFLKWAKYVRIHIPSRFTNWEPFDSSRLIKGAFYQSSAAEAAYLNKAFDVTLSLNLRSIEAETWIEKYAASEIKYIDASSKQAIKQIILRAFQEGITSKEQANLIKPFIGLTPRQATALENYTALLIDQGTNSAIVDKLTETYSEKLLNARAWNIAITEGHTASNEGFRAQNADAVERGILDPEKYERRWLVTDDDRLCEECEAMDGETAELPDGEFPGGEEPPLHNLCRCTEEIVRIED